MLEASSAPEPKRKETGKPVSIRMPEETRTRLERYAARKGFTLSGFLRRVAEATLAQEDRQALQQQRQNRREGPRPLSPMEALADDEAARTQRLSSYFTPAERELLEAARLVNDSLSLSNFIRIAALTRANGILLRHRDRDGKERA